MSTGNHAVRLTIHKDNWIELDLLTKVEHNVIEQTIQRCRRASSTFTSLRQCWWQQDM
jgi:hypothetical protein